MVLELLDDEVQDDHGDGRPDRVIGRQGEHEGRDHGQDGPDDGHQLEHPRDDGQEHRERQEHRVHELAQDDEAREGRDAHHRAQDELTADPAAEGVVDDAQHREGVAAPRGGQGVLERPATGGAGP